MRPPSIATIRLFLHILAATVWVGGQLTLAGLVGVLRTVGPDAPRAVARRFNRIAWPAFFVLVVTGVWNLAAVDALDAGGAYAATLAAKLGVVGVSGVAAFLHSISTSRVGLAVWGALAALSALAALFLGVQLRT